MFFASAGLLALCGLLPVNAQNVPTYGFLSRPDIVAPAMKVATANHELMGEGFIFLTPSTPAPANFTFGMRMYNSNGSLVWDGTSFNVPDHQITDFNTCNNFQGAPHLCVTMFQGPVGGGVARNSYSLVIDNTYKQVLATGPSYVYNGAKLNADLHEFNIVGSTGASSLMSSYAIKEQEVTFPNCPGHSQIGWVKNGLFTETSTDGQNTTIFAWSAMDHVPVSDSYLCPCQDPQAGCGSSQSDPFDFFHINAIDKNDDGDYIVSGRHMWTLYKVAGLHSPSGMAPGSVIWRLGGKQNSFRMETTVPNSGSFNFSYQHHVRWRDGGLHFWDNANDAITQATAHSSSGMGVDIDEDALVATLTSQAVPPSGALDSSQGSHQILPNGNHFCGLGSVPEVYERTATGELVFDAYFGVEPMQSYRAFRSPWVGHPSTDQLRIFSFAPACGARNAYHISWNGATEVASYRFFVSNSSAGPFVPTGGMLKDYRFENTGIGDRFGHYGYGEALDAQGNVMGRTPTVKTFVPAPQIAHTCNNIQCGDTTDYTKTPQAVCP